MNWTLIGQSAIAGCIVATFAATLARLLAWKPFKQHRANQRRLIEQQAVTNDRLDTHTEGGLTEVVEAVKAITPPRPR